jgi:alcohol dehydrogenase (cytochrome c)
MSAGKWIVAAALLAASLGSNGTKAAAQQVDAEMLKHQPKDSWLTYHGDYSGRRHSALTEINKSNVANMTMLWSFQTAQAQGIKSTPILYDGVLYFTIPDNIWAIDARNGRQLWRYTAPPNTAFHIGQRGVAILNGHLFYMSTDAHALSLNAKTGKVEWDVVVADVTKGQWSTLSPLVVGNHVIVSASGDFDNLPGFVRALDPETGATQWTWHSTPPLGTPKSTTGGWGWMTGTYDPEMNTLFWGTGNPTPVLNGQVRPGDNLYTCSIVALDPETGKLKWAFQPSPHDTHDWDAVETPVLVDAPFKGKPRKMLMQASRNGYFFVLDRTDGSSLLTVPFGPVNWATGIDKRGEPVGDPKKEPAPDGRIIAPDEGGLTNFRSPSFDTKVGLFIVDASPSYSLYFSKPADGTYGWAGADYSLWSKSVIEAIDYQTGKIKWSHDLGDRRSAASVMTTEGGLVFTGDGYGNLLALDDATGKTLWHAGAGGGMGGPPITYEMDGHQVVLLSGGGVLYAWGLPHSTSGNVSKVSAKH